MPDKQPGPSKEPLQLLLIDLVVDKDLAADLPRGQVDEPGAVARYPRGAHETEVWRWFLVDKNAPAEVKDFLRDYYVRYSGPGGMTEQDDMENWNYAHAASRGTIARRYPYSYEQGLGTEVENYEWQGFRVPGTVCDLTQAKSSEHNLRNLYRRWAEFMEARSWDELMSWRRQRQAAAAE